MREYSIPALAEIPASANLADLVTRRAAEEPQAVMLRRQKPDGSWQDVTAAQFRDDVYALAKGLIATGLAPGDRIAIMSRTRYEWTVLDYAIWSIGGVVVPIYETSSAEQAEWILTDTMARAIIVETEDFERLIGGSRDRIPALQYLWRMDTALREVIGAGAAISDQVVAERTRTARAANLATIIYTSGTTGRSKGCEITHENMLAVSRNAIMGPLSALTQVREPSTVLFLPLAHVFARVIQVTCLESGVILGHCPDLTNVLPTFATFKPSFVLGVPRVFEKVYNGAEQKAVADGKGKIFARAADVAVEWSRATETPRGPSLGLRLQHAVFNKLVYGKLRAALGGRAEGAISGGAALSERIGHFFRGVGVAIIEGYGLTETTAPVSVNRGDRQKVGTVGQPLPGVAVRIDDDGEILVKGKTVLPAYWRNDQATKDAFTPDGWYKTGDLGMLDDEGFLSITGRKKEIIVTAGGKNVSPTLLEDRLRSHLLISQCLVVGDAKPFIGALITIDPEAFEPWKERLGKPASATVADLRDDPDLVAAIQESVDDANSAVSRAESIRKFRILTTDFTQEQGHLSAKLGIKRNVLAKEFADEIEALYSR